MLSRVGKFSNALDDVDLDTTLPRGPQIRFLKDFGENWRPGTSKLRFPLEWQVRLLPARVI